MLPLGIFTFTILLAAHKTVVAEMHTFEKVLQIPNVLKGISQHSKNINVAYISEKPFLKAMIQEY